jgi:hypothetical protein
VKSRSVRICAGAPRQLFCAERTTLLIAGDTRTFWQRTRAAVDAFRRDVAAPLFRPTAVPHPAIGWKYG